MRYIQAGVSDEDHREFSKFAFVHEPQLTLNDLIEISVKKYIEDYRKKNPSTTTTNP